MVPTQKRRPKWKALLLLMIFFLGVAVAIFFTSPLSKVKRIEVTGNNQITTDQILNASGLQTGMNIWEVKKESINQQMQSQIPLLAKADVEIHFPGEVIIAVAEKPVAAIYAAKGSKYRLLSDGTVLDKVNQWTGLPLLTSTKEFPVELGKKFPDPNVQKFCQQIVKVDKSLLEPISNFEIKDGNLWSAWTIPNPEQFEIRFPLENISATLNVYSKFWKNQLESKNKTSGIIFIYGEDEAWYQQGDGQQRKE